MTSGHAQVLDPSVVSAAPHPGKPGPLVYSGGNMVAVGQILAIGRGAATPDGFLGRVTDVRDANGQVIVSTQPVSLLQAVPSGALDATLSTSSVSAERDARGALARAAAAAVTCKGSMSASISAKVSFNAGIQLKGSWSLFGGLQSASLTADASAKASISATAKAGGSCKLKPTTLVSFDGPSVETFVGPIPVVLTSEISVDLDANAAVHASLTTGASAGFSASAGLGWTKQHGFYPIQSFRPKFSYTPPTLAADATVAANLTPKVDVLLYGLAGPEIALSSGLALDADITHNPWWKLTAPVDLTASLVIPALKLSSPTWHVYRHSFTLATAGGPFGGAPHPTVTVNDPGNQSSTTGTPVSVQVQASDSDGGALTYAAAGLPPNLTIDPSTGLITGTPTAGATYTVTVTATDAGGPSASTTFIWTVTQAAITFDGSPGTGVPPSTLGSYPMQAFGPDSDTPGDTVTSVTGPTGPITFDTPLLHDLVGGGWSTWSNGYTGDVYEDDQQLPDGSFAVTVSLPPGTGAFYLYAEPNIFQDFAITATAQDGTTSGALTVNGDTGAQYVGFYAACGQSVTSVQITDTGGDTALAIGEFGIAPVSACGTASALSHAHAMGRSVTPPALGSGAAPGAGFAQSNAQSNTAARPRTRHLARTARSRRARQRSLGHPSIPPPIRRRPR